MSSREKGVAVELLIDTGRRPAEIYAQGQITRQTARIRQLEKKLSELLGEQTWRESGLGAPADIDQLQR